MKQNLYSARWAVRVASAALALALGCTEDGTAPDAGALGGELRLYYLDLVGGVRTARADGSEAHLLIAGEGVGPDGVDVDVVRGHVYWTNMGAVSADDGTIMRADLDGTNVVTVVPVGHTFTPKQLKLDLQNDKLYWSDREGMRVMRANLDGSEIKTLVVTGEGDADRVEQRRWCVGIALDVARGQLYFTQKGGDNAGEGTIKRMPLELAAATDPAQRDDVETLFSDLPEPIDLDLDLETRTLYWTDRGDNTVSRAPLDATGFDPKARTDREVLVEGLGEAIGLSLDLENQRMYYTSLSTGVVGSAALDGSGATDLISGQGVLTGIVAVAVPNSP